MSDDTGRGQSKSLVDLRTDYDEGEQASASDMNAANGLLKKLVSNNDLLNFRHLESADGIECTLKIGELRAFIKEEAGGGGSDYEGDIQEWDGSDWTNSGIAPSNNGEILYWDETNSTWAIANSSPSYDGDILYWDNENSKWYNAGISPSDNGNLLHWDDANSTWAVSDASPSNDGDLLHWDSDNNKWTNVGVNPSEGDMLYYDGSTWQTLSKPGTDGDYALVVSVSSGTPTLSWRAMGCNTTT